MSIVNLDCQAVTGFFNRNFRARPFIPRELPKFKGSNIKGFGETAKQEENLLMNGISCFALLN